MKKPQLKLIEIIAKNLPTQQIQSSINSVVSGEDAILAGTNEIKGEEVDPGKDYIIGNSLIRDINHKGRLKRAFKKLGKNGLILYCKQYMKNDSSELEQAINAAF